uniref:Uncharacterized protein n=1 Tax=viral metagenome TaxID=1070528 RepID=A0A6C0K0J3_9ZZZZ
MNTASAIEKNYIEMSSRSVIDVANQILPLIPDKEYALKRDITKYIESQYNKAPESLRGSICWIPFVHILNKHVGIFDEDWKIQTRNIVNNTHDEIFMQNRIDYK